MFRPSSLFVQPPNKMPLFLGCLHYGPLAYIMKELLYNEHNSVFSTTRRRVVYIYCACKCQHFVLLWYIAVCLLPTSNCASYYVTDITFMYHDAFASTKANYYTASQQPLQFANTTKHVKKIWKSHSSTLHILTHSYYYSAFESARQLPLCFSFPAECAFF